MGLGVGDKELGNCLKYFVGSSLCFVGFYIKTFASVKLLNLSVSVYPNSFKILNLQTFSHQSPL